MSTQGAPNQYSLWSWLEKDLKNKSIKQKYMLKCDVKLNTNNNNQKINIQNQNAMESESKRKSATSRNDHRKRKKKKKRDSSTTTTQIHYNVEVQKNRISDYLQPHDDDLEGDRSASTNSDYYGEAYTSKADGTIRIWFTNPCGIGINHNDIKSHDSFKFLRQKSRCDLFGLAETNVQWNKLRGSSSFYSRVKNSWQDFRTVTGHNILQDLGLNQRGGNGMATVGQVSFRMTKAGRDISKLGRWVWMDFSGSEGYITRVYTAYRPGAIKPASSQKTTVYDQHDRYIRGKNLGTTPREMFDEDLRCELQAQLHFFKVV